jgi:DNA-binding response OmpR family regulator
MSEAEAGPGNSGSLRVLIVPHCWDCGGSLQMLLSLSGITAEIVRGGDVAVGRALEVRPEVVLVDAGLDGEDGFEVARRLRVALGAGVRLIALGVGDGCGDPAEWAGARVDAWLRKPVDPAELLEVVGGQ